MKKIQPKVKVDNVIVENRFREDLGTDKSPLILDEQKLSTLIESIKTHGLIHPIAVSEIEESDKYRLIAGGRRLEAFKQLKIEEIPVHIFPHEITELKARTLEVLENAHRKSLSWQEKTKSAAELDRLMKLEHGERKQGQTKEKSAGWGVSDTAKALGKTVRPVAQDIELAKAMETFPEVKSAKTRQEAIGRLNTLKTQTGMPVMTESEENKPMLDELRGALKSSFFSQEIDDPDVADKLKKIQPRFFLLLNPVSDEKLEFLLSIVTGGAWFVSFDPNAFEQFQRYQIKTKEGIWVWQTQDIGGANELSQNYAKFYYGSFGTISLPKKRSAVFNFKAVPRHLKVHNDERPIELYAELISIFTFPRQSAVVPDGVEGNVVLAGTNAMTGTFAFGKTEGFIESYERKIDTMEVGKFTSYPHVVKQKDLE